jgi:hypothetical protein
MLSCAENNRYSLFPHARYHRIVRLKDQLQVNEVFFYVEPVLVQRDPVTDHRYNSNAGTDHTDKTYPGRDHRYNIYPGIEHRLNSYPDKNYIQRQFEWRCKLQRRQVSWYSLKRQIYCVYTYIYIYVCIYIYIYKYSYHALVHIQVVWVRI